MKRIGLLIVALFVLAIGLPVSTYADTVQYALTNPGSEGGWECDMSHSECANFSVNSASYDTQKKQFSINPAAGQLITLSPFVNNVSITQINDQNITSVITANYSASGITMDIVTTNSKKPKDNPWYTLSDAVFSPLSPG